MTSRNEKLFEQVIIQFLLFIMSFGLAFISSQIISKLMPLSNPDSIVNVFTLREGFKPEQNFFQILWIISITLVLFVFMNYLLESHPRKFRLTVVFFALVSIFCIHILPQVTSYTKNLDTFHNGEQLSPASDFNAGKGLFSEIYVLHGGGEDVLVPSFALHMSNVFNPGAGFSFYLLTVFALQFISTFLFVALLSLIFKKTSLFLVIVLWFVFGYFSYIHFVRDIFTWISLLTVYCLLFFKISESRKKAVYVFLGLWSSLTLFYALDRGIIVSIITLMAAAVSLLMTRNKNGSLAISRPKGKEDYYFLLLVAGGFMIGQLFIIMFNGFNQYLEFVKMYLFDIPASQGLLFNLPLPGIVFNSIAFWLPVILSPLAVLMLYRLIRSAKRNSIPADYVYSAVLIIAGIIFLRAGYSRPAIGHVAYSAPVLLTGIFYTTYLYYIKYKRSVEMLVPALLIIVLLLIPTVSIDYKSVDAFLNTKLTNVVRFIRLPLIKDTEWVPDNVDSVADYIRTNSSADDPLFVYTQQPIYYYLTQRRNPTRFYITWFADPKPLEDEMLESLKQSQPKFIIYSSGTEWDAPDGAIMKDRTPEVENWIKENYPNEHKVGDVVILSE
jgi:hypothetical protein